MPINVSYYDGVDNFGDSLNALFWPALLDIKSTGSDRAILGIGTIINDTHVRKFKSCELTIVGSGIGYGTLQKLPAATRISFVRGPLTCETIGIDTAYGIGDPAYVAQQVLGLDATSTGPKQISFLPHFESAYLYRWDWVCKAIGFCYISPAQTFPSVYNQIRNSSVLITESLHGAVVADSMRIPWIAVKTRDEINEFKWQDFLSSLGMHGGLMELTPPTPGRRVVFNPQSLWKAGKRLMKLANASVSLSSDSVSEVMKERILAKLANLKQAVLDGDFSRIPLAKDLLR